MSSQRQAPAALLLLPRLHVQNANAISSPLTWGFPPPTAFLGFCHALERRLAGSHGQTFDGIGIVCHSFEPQTFRPNRRAHLIFNQSRNPIYLKRDIAKYMADATPAAIVEEGRAHMEVSLVVALRGAVNDEAHAREFADEAYQAAHTMRLAGGSVMPSSRPRQPSCVPWPEALEDQAGAFRRLRRQLLPGFALVHRPDLLAQHVEARAREYADESSLLDALLDLTRLNHYPASVQSPGAEPVDRPDQPPASPESADTSKTEWRLRTQPGWLVPLPIGYAGISPLHAAGTVGNARDVETPFRFVESLYSLGQWIGPHRLSNLQQLLWHSEAEPEIGLYRSINRYAEAIDHSDNLQGA